MAAASSRNSSTMRSLIECARRWRARRQRDAGRGAWAPGSGCGVDGALFMADSITPAQAARRSASA